MHNGNGAHQEARQKLVVVGNGMAGVACVEQILKHAPKFDITIFGDETHVNYNRILLSSVLAGEKSPDEIVLNDLDWYERNRIRLRLGVRITGVDAGGKTVTGEDGSITPFDKLLLATGSSPLIPSLEWVKKQGVFVFRSLDDTRELLERAKPGTKAVVIGGGLLGLEAARGLQVQGCDVTVVHLMDTLMERQLDHAGGGYLKAKMECMGIRVLLGRSTTEILGNGKAEGVAFKEGPSIPADFVVIAAGIRPNTELGRKAGLQVNRGIVVNDYMETSNPDIFARNRLAQFAFHLVMLAGALQMSLISSVTVLLSGRRCAQRSFLQPGGARSWRASMDSVRETEASEINAIAISCIGRSMVIGNN